MIGRQVFFDASGTRTRWTTRIFLSAYLTLFLLCAVFTATIIDLPRPDPLKLAAERPRRHAQTAGATTRWAANDTDAGAGRPAAPPAVNLARSGRQLRVGFYAPWDSNSGASLLQHIDQLDWLVAGLITVSGPQHQVRVAGDARLDAALARARTPVALFPMVQNAIEEDWDGDGAAEILADPKARAALLDHVQAVVMARKAQGATFDFEALPDSARSDYLRLIREARTRFSARHWQVIVTLPAASTNWELKAYGLAADRVIFKAFDQHPSDSPSGPIAGHRWFAGQLARATSRVSADKLIVAIGSFAYDWPGDGEAELMSVEEAWLTAHDSQAPIRFEPRSGNPVFAYEEGDRPHEVWMLDAATGWNQLRAAHLSGAAGVAIWRLGTEDSGVWKVLANLAHPRPPDIATLQSHANVDVAGSGEILRIASVPTDGRRAISVDDGGLITNERFDTLPTPYAIHRTGSHPGTVALTFDDGPDPQWTPQILKILQDKGVPATFFVIGENALGNRLLLNQIVDQGHELGNHTFTHPNLAIISPQQAMLELNMSQRLVQAYTGRSLRLFRAPYFSDAEGTTADELRAALIAQENGYVNVGLHVDPNDWNGEDSASIIRAVVSQVRGARSDDTRQIILLHDGGGDRSQTVAALPHIIDDLRALGYRFASVSTLAGLRRTDTMPAVAPKELIAVRADVGLFMLFAALGEVVKWIFYAAILIGIARAVFTTTVAIWSYERRRRTPRPVIDPGLLVSVLIPAHNEERVIEAAIRQVLASRDVRIDVIVVDDGSTDATASIVRNAFWNDPAVRLISVANGGKAKALNLAAKLARGDVLIALDADTLFGPYTIARLRRWFADPRIGAVAGNVQVGNKINLITRWQSIEYVTAQNLERRALAALNCIMVVPGAVGAIRRTALARAGGYPEDTLAEDQDLTIQIQRDGWRVAYDPAAMAWTEAPESLVSLARQRFRWAFGTLQCLWKHRSILRTFKPKGLALIGIPQALLFQIGFSLIAPVIDLLLAINIVSTAVHSWQHGWTGMHGEGATLALYWLGFTAIDILCGYAAYAMEPRRERCPVLLLIAQRLVYRQLMYWVMIRAVSTALRGPTVRWGQPKRSGRLGKPRRRLFQRRRPRAAAGSSLPA